MENRKTIERVKGALSSQGYNTENAVASQGYLRLLSSIQATTNTVTFTVPANQGTIRATERRLAITDMFTVTHWGLYIVKAGASTTATDTEIAASLQYTNPNPLVFLGASEAANLRNIYNGYLSVSIDRKVILDSYDCWRFWRVGVAQQGLQQTVTATVGVYGFDEWQGPNYGMAEVDPEITINGIGQTDITLTLPSSVNLGGTSSQNFLALACRGIRWQNVSKLNQ